MLVFAQIVKFIISLYYLVPAIYFACDLHLVVTIATVIFEQSMDRQR